MYRIKNTADDRSKVNLHRLATRFELEPSIGGHRIRLRQHLDITEEHYTRIKEMIDIWVSKGMVEVSKIETSLKDQVKQHTAPLGVARDSVILDEVQDFIEEKTLSSSIVVPSETQDSIKESLVDSQEPTKRGPGRKKMF